MTVLHKRNIGIPGIAIVIPGTSRTKGREACEDTEIPAACPDFNSL